MLTQNRHFCHETTVKTRKVALIRHCPRSLALVQLLLLVLLMSFPRRIRFRSRAARVVLSGCPPSWEQLLSLPRTLVTGAFDCPEPVTLWNAVQLGLPGPSLRLGSEFPLLAGISEMTPPLIASWRVTVTPL